MRFCLLAFAALSALAVPEMPHGADQPPAAARPVVHGVVPGPREADAPTREEIIAEILHQRALRGGSPILESEAFEPFPLDPPATGDHAATPSDREQFARQLRGMMGEPPAEGGIAPAGFSPPQTISPLPGSRRRDHDLKRTNFEREGELYSSAASNQNRRVRVLRHSAWELDRAAHALELQELYDQADALRRTAQRLRQDARDLRVRSR